VSKGEPQAVELFDFGIAEVLRGPPESTRIDSSATPIPIRIIDSSVMPAMCGVRFTLSSESNE
jgi:hypothetical protein